MLYWISDMLLVLAWWLVKARPMNRAGKLGVSCWVAAAIVWMALVCSTADSKNLWAAFRFSTGIAIAMAGIGLLIIIVGAALEVARLRRNRL